MQEWLAGDPQAEQVVQAAIEPRLSRHPANRQQDARYVSFAARGPVGDRHGLAWKSEDHFLVSDKSRQTNAVDRDAALLPTSRPSERFLLGLLVGEGLVAA